MAPSASASSTTNPWFERRNRPYVWRKLFSLCGVVPIAVYTGFHLWANAKAVQGRQTYVQMVGDLGQLPYLTVLEIGLIFLPILVHATIGIKILLDARYNLGAYPLSGNWGFTLQRVTALIILGFLGYHLWELRIQKLLVGMDGGGFYDTLCRNLSGTMGGVPVVALIYILGIGAVSFHFANGLWGFCFSWGITVSRTSQRRAASLCGIVGLFVFLLGANTTLFFATGSKLFVPSEWFNPAHPPTEGCPAPALDFPSANEPVPPASAPTAAPTAAD